MAPENDSSFVCHGEPAGATVTNAASGEELAIACLSWAAYGDPKANPLSRHLIEVRLEGGTWITLGFPMATKGGTTLTVAPMDTSTSETIGSSTTASLFDESGWEGAPRDLCDAGGEGTLRLDRVAVSNTTAMLISADGEASISFARCTSPELNVTDGPVNLTVTF